MLERHERIAILKLIQAERTSSRESVETAALYAGQTLLATLLLLVGFEHFHSSAALWAAVSAALVIQPAIEQAIAATIVRVAANTVGGFVGIAVGATLGDGIWQVLVALTMVVVVCERLRLDVGLRSACVSVLIIMLKMPGQTFSTGQERLIAVVIGCVTALIIQLLAERLRKLLGWHEQTPITLTPAPAPIQPTKPEHDQE